MDKKQRLYRLIESYINDFKGDAVQEMYGTGTKIKIHTINFVSNNKKYIVSKISNELEDNWGHLGTQLLRRTVKKFIDGIRL